MLKKRLIPILLLKNGRMVKTVKFGESRDVGSPISTAKIYDAQCADEIIFLDILASVEGRQSLISIIDEVTKECFMPIAVGGGVKTTADIETLLKAGADKIVINTAAVIDPNFLKEAANRFGSANIVSSIDYKKVGNENKVFIYGGKRESKYAVNEWAREVERLGAGEIVINSIDRDGTMEGYDLGTIREICALLNIPVVVCGGAGKLIDFQLAIEAGADAVAAGSIFHFTDQSPIKARAFMKESKVNIRFV